MRNTGEHRSYVYNTYRRYNTYTDIILSKKYLSSTSVYWSFIGMVQKNGESPELQMFQENEMKVSRHQVSSPLGIERNSKDE